MEKNLKEITNDKNEFNKLEGVTVVGVFYDSHGRYLGKGLVKECDGHHTQTLWAIEKPTSPKTSIFIQQYFCSRDTKTFTFKALGPFNERFYTEKPTAYPGKENHGRVRQG